jgi:hypothetical protein
LTNISTSVATNSALVLAAGTSVRFLPNPAYNGTPGSLTARLIDDSAGAVTSGSTVDVTTSGGTTQYSSAANAITLTTNVTAINDAPVIANLNGDARGYAMGSGAVVVDQGAAAGVSDIDSADFSGGN